MNRKYSYSSYNDSADFTYDISSYDMFDFNSNKMNIRKSTNFWSNIDLWQNNIKDVGYL